MLIGFCLYKWFPYGGLQRDMLKIALECQKRGHRIRVYTLKWEGPVPDGFELVLVPAPDFSRIYRNHVFARWVQNEVAQRPVDRLVGFNKMPGLDVYYGADPCFEERMRAGRSFLRRLTLRYHHHAAFERAVFDPHAKTEILLLSDRQKPHFQRHYGTPEGRFHLLPPGISADRRAPADYDRVREEERKGFGLDAGELMVLQIGSGFRTKGVDRTLAAFASLPPALASRSRLVVIGQDRARPFLRQARNLKIDDRVSILAGRSDIPRFLLAADLLIHPAYAENTGTVLLEAVVAGLPVLVTDVCGFASYVREAGAGRVLESPFKQSSLNGALADILGDTETRRRWSANGRLFGETADLYSLAERAADIITGARP
ncbi:MAG: glycosyltransferase family 4 protein [Deltaproteobacteria bacterium]|nr:glycosyltransferase family 4 protein [Deltaproteobacteria bacterium]